jgi:hypothetical protein
MRIPRVRFTVRRMMLAVAVAGITLGALLMWQCSINFRSRADDHALSCIDRTLAARDWYLEAEKDRKIAEIDRTRMNRPAGIDVSGTSTGRRRDAPARLTAS